MTYATFKTRLNRRLVHNQLSPVALSVTYGSDFCVATREHLADFCRAVEAIYVNKATLTLVLNDQTVDLTAAVTTYDIYDPYVIYISNSEVERVSLFDINETNQATVSAGTPNSWAKLDFYKIIFDKPCASGLTGTYVSGLADHPAIANDNVVLSLSDFDVPAALDYIAAEFASDVAGDEIGLAIAARFRARADKGMKQVLARNRAQRVFVYGGGI